MKIVHFIYQFSTGGLENGLINLINYLPEDKYQHIVICLTSNSHFSERVKTKNVQVISLNLPPGPLYRHYPEIYRMLRKIKPDIVHTRNLSAIELQMVAFIARIRYRIHGEHGRGLADLKGINLKHIILRRMMSPFIHRFVSLSKEIKVYLVKKVSIQNKKIKQIYNGVNLDVFKPVIKNNTLIKIAMIGRMEPVKDPCTTIRALKILSQRFKNIQLTIAGEGSMMPIMQCLVKELDLSAQVDFLGDSSQIHQILNACDIFVQSSLVEGISNTILEAMASGLPVVATNVGGNCEIVEERITGRLVAPGSAKELADAIAYYIEDKERRIEQGKNARKRAEKDFSLQRMIEQYDNLYKQMA